MEKMRNFYDKAEGKMITGKMYAEQKMDAFLRGKKSGASHWVDLGVACIVGLALALVFKDKLAEVIESVASKISTNITAW